MCKKTIVRAWKDAEFRASLSEAERAALPANPAGEAELTEAELKQVTGGMYLPTAPIMCKPSLLLFCPKR
jgi:mersacidin/lichenicidin family type 2 lantibiotic